MPRSRRRKRKLNLPLLLLLIIILIVFRLYNEVDQDKKPDGRFVVARVIDGDTIELSGGDKLRLLSVDTPEKTEKYYSEAKAFFRTGRLK